MQRRVRNDQTPIEEKDAASNIHEEEDINENQPIGFHKTGKQQEEKLLNKFKENLKQIRDSFENESAQILKSAAARIKSSAWQKEEASNKLLVRWQASLLQNLSQKNYSIKANNLTDLIFSPEYARLKKMFIDADLDFSEESRETQAAIERFIKTIDDVETWILKRSQLSRMGSPQPLLINNASTVQDKSLTKFIRECNAIKQQFDDITKKLFSYFSDLSNKVSAKKRELSALNESAKDVADDDKKYEEIQSKVKQKKIELEQHTRPLENSKFFFWYLRFNQNPISESLPELLESDAYQELKHIFTENNAEDFAKETFAVQAIMKELHEIMLSAEAKTSEKEYTSAYPVSTYKPPSPHE